MSDWWWQSIRWELFISYRKKKNRKNLIIFPCIRMLKNVFSYLWFLVSPYYPWGFPGGSVVENPPAYKGDAGDMGSIPRSGRSPGGGHGNPLQYSCLENPIDRGAWRTTVHGVTESQTRLSTHTHVYYLYICFSQCLSGFFNLCLAIFFFGGRGQESSVIMLQILLCFHSLSSLSGTQLHAY